MRVMFYAAAAIQMYEGGGHTNMVISCVLASDDFGEGIGSPLAKIV